MKTVTIKLEQRAALEIMLLSNQLSNFFPEGSPNACMEILRDSIKEGIARLPEDEFRALINQCK